MTGAVICSQCSGGWGCGQRPLRRGQEKQGRKGGRSLGAESLLWSSFPPQRGGPAHNGLEVSGFYMENGVLPCGVVLVRLTHSGPQTRLEACCLCNRQLSVRPPSVGLGPRPWGRPVTWLCVVSTCGERLLVAPGPSLVDVWRLPGAPGAFRLSGAWSQHAVCRRAGLSLLF